MYLAPETDLQVVDAASRSWRCLLFIDRTGLMSESPKPLRAKVIFVHRGGKNEVITTMLLVNRVFM